MSSPCRSENRCSSVPTVAKMEMMPAHSLSFNDTAEMSRNDQDSCMDLCSSSSSDDCESEGAAAKMTPVNSELKQKLRFARGIFLNSASKQIDMIDLCSPGGSEDKAERCSKRLKFSHDIQLFDRVQHVDRDELNRTRNTQPLGLLSASRHTSHPSNNSDSEWAEFGVFSSTSTETDSEVTLLKDVIPSFSPSELKFFTSMGIYNSYELMEADTIDLSINLLGSQSFKRACAFFAWKDGKPLRDYLRISVARSIIVKCKNRLVNQNSEIASMNDSSETMNNEELITEVPPDVNTDIENTDTNDDDESKVEDSEATEIPLSNVLSNEESRMLRDCLDIETANQLINADGQYLRQKLRGAIAHRFEGRTTKELECICEGMIYSWTLRLRDKLGSNMTETTIEIEATSSEDSQSQRPQLQTPLSFADYSFLKQVHIFSDQDLSDIDPSLLTRQYQAFMNKNGNEIDCTDANKKLKELRQDASLMCRSASSSIKSPQMKPQANRIDLNKLLTAVMPNVTNLCKTIPDENNDGLPRKSIVVYDDNFCVLYEFLVSINDSKIPNAGKGAFLTFSGAKVLKKSLSSKSTRLSAKDRRTPLTRNPLEAHFPSSGATVTLTGRNLHGDEYLFKTKRDDSVGIWNEFTLDDFVDPDSNITFSSEHVGCALIELDRYAPVIKADRKTDFIFGVKDFIFSHEPASWRFDVREELDGLNQVVDFTDDTTGLPHAAARSNTAMYVNECGHDDDLVENVCSLGPCRSVSYYIYIDEPMQAGETRELLINYRGKYEDIRERRGYGLANIRHGVKGDDDDVTRVLRNQKERLSTQTTIMSCREEEIKTVLDFIKQKVLDGVIEAISVNNADMNVLARQFVARRRIHWLSKLCERRLLELIGNQEANLQPCNDVGIFREGMIVFVNGWMDKQYSRPKYTGLATILSISKDKFDRQCLELSLPKGKYLANVPAAAVTLPVEEDFADAPRRLHLEFLNLQKERYLPQVRNAMLDDITSMEWDISSLNQCISTSQKKIKHDLMWEVAEEVLFQATRDKTVTQPLVEVAANFAAVIDRYLVDEEGNNCASFYVALCAIAGLKNPLIVN